jgi:hypothetical protein
MNEWIITTTGTGPYYYKSRPGVVVVVVIVVLFLARQPPVGQALVIHEISWSHTTTHHFRWDSSGPVISSSERPVVVVLVIVVFVFSATASSGPGPHQSRALLITHNDEPHSVGLLWTSDQLVAETCSSSKLFFLQLHVPLILNIILCKVLYISKCLKIRLNCGFPILKLRNNKKRGLSNDT